MYWPNLKSVAFPIPEIIAIGFLGRVRTPILGKGRPYRVVVPLERALVSSYRLPIATFSLSVRVSEILPLLCSRTPFFPPHL